MRRPRAERITTRRGAETADWLDRFRWEGRGARARSGCMAQEQSPLVLAEEILDAGLEGHGDLVERRDRRRRLRALDLRQQRDAEPGAARHLLQGEVLVLAQVADGVADDAVELLLRRARQALLAHDAREGLAELVDVEGLLDVVDGV